MAINRYDTPAQDKYFNTYVPLPYEQLMATVGARQSQLTKAQDMLAQTAENAKNLKYIPGTQDELDVKNYLSNIDNLVNKFYTSDMTNPVVRQQLMSQFNSMTDRTHLQNIQTSASNWEANNKIRANEIANGTYSPYLDQDPANNPDFSSRSGVYQYTTPKFESYIPEAQRFWANVHPHVFLDKNGNPLTTPEGYNKEGYSEEYNKAYIGKNWGSFAQTPTGRSWIEHELRSRGLEDTNQNREAIATELLLNQQPTGSSLTGSRYPQGSSSSTRRGDRDAEWWFYKGAQNQAGDSRSNKQAIEKDRKQYQQNLLDLDKVNAQLDLLKKDTVDVKDIRYVTLQDAKDKLEGDIGKHEEVENKINTETQKILDENAEVLKNKYAQKIVDNLGGDIGSVKKIIDANINKELGKGVRKEGFDFGALTVSGFARGVSVVPYIGQLVINKIHRGINKLGVLSDTDKNNLIKAAQNAVQERQLSGNPTFGELLGAARQTITDYAKNNKKTWGQDVYNSIVDKSFVNQMEQLDEGLTDLNNNMDKAREEALGKVYNYNVSTAMVKPLNYVMRNGQKYIVDEEGNSYLSQMDDLGETVKTNPGSFDIEDVSDGKRIKQDKNFKTSIQKIMATYDPLPGSINPTIDKDGNIHVQLAYQISSPTAQGEPIKKFDVKISDPALIRGLAQDYRAAGYNGAFTRLSFGNIHKDVEVHANSSTPYDYSLLKPSMDGGEPEIVSVRVKRDGATYVVESPSNPNVPAREIAADGTFRNLVFNTKEELESWLYSKQTSLLFD